jgi:hypothetical protein
LFLGIVGQQVKRKNEINSMREIMEAIVLEKNGSNSIRKKMEVFSPIHSDLQFLKTTN